MELNETIAKPIIQLKITEMRLALAGKTLLKHGRYYAITEDYSKYLAVDTTNSEHIIMKQEFKSLKKAKQWLRLDVKEDTGTHDDDIDSEEEI